MKNRQIICVETKIPSGTYVAIWEGKKLKIGNYIVNTIINAELKQKILVSVLEGIIYKIS